MTSSEIDALWNYHKPEVSEEKFRKLLLAKSDSPTNILFQIKVQLVRALGLQGKFEEGHQLLDELDKQPQSQSQLCTVRFCLERGRLFNSAGDPKTASRYFKQAFTSSTDTGDDFYKVDAAHMLGISEPSPENHKWNLRALKIARKSSNERTQTWKASLANNIAWYYHESGDFDQALIQFRYALVLRLKSSKMQGANKAISIAKWSVARCLRSLNKLDEALKMQQSLLAAMNPNDPSGFVYEEIGECLHKMNRPTEAAPFFANAHELLSQHKFIASSEPQRLDRLKELSRL